MDWSCAACGAGWPASHRFCAHCGTPHAAVATEAQDVTDVLRALVGEELAQQVVEQGGRLPEQRRLVTALFADLSGFTPLAGRLDPEELAAVVDPILAGLTRIVRRGEGYVGSFAGDALLAFFGAPVAHEDDAERALRCAAQMLEEFPALLAEAGPAGSSLSLRIGVDTGAVMARLVAGDVRTDYAVMGNAVNMAQRLQSNAPPGGCFVGETTARLAERAFELRSVGGLQVKGREEPLPAWELVAERRQLVQRRARSVATLLGRGAELAVLDEALRPGPARAVLLTGEAGLGKSRLLEELRTRTDRTWLEGGCVAHDPRTYRPWASVSRAAVVQGTEPAVDPAQRRHRAAIEVAQELRAAAPVVVALEDLHWADQPSVELLDDLLYELGDADVLLVATSRDRVEMTAEVRRLEVAPLGPGAVGELVGELLGGAPPEALVDDIARRSGGNPLYAAELARALADRGVVQLREGGVLAVAPEALEQAVVPDSLEGLIGARIDALPASPARTLTITAVLGAPVDRELVAAVAARSAVSASVVESDLVVLTELGFLAGGAFVHAVVPDTAYARTPRARRRELHLAAAEVAGQVPAAERAGFLARHLYLGAAGARAVAALVVAGDEATARSALEEAVLHLQREIELRRADPSERPALPDRLTVLGTHLETLGRYDEAERVLREAVALGADARAERALVGSLRRLGRYEDAVGAADLVLVSSFAGPDVLAAVSEEKGWSLAAQGLLDEAIAALSPAPDALAQARHDLLRGYCLQQRGSADEAVGLLRDAAAALRPHGALAARALRLLGQTLGRSGDLEAAAAALLDGLEVARSSGAAEELAACLTTLASVHAAQQDLEAAIRANRAAVVQSDRMSHTFGRTMSRNNLAFALHLTGAHDEAVEVASRAVDIAVANGAALAEGSALHTRGSALLALGRATEAAGDAERSAELLVGTDDEQESWQLAAAAWAAAGDQERAAAATGRVQGLDTRTPAER